MYCWRPWSPFTGDLHCFGSWLVYYMVISTWIYFNDVNFLFGLIFNKWTLWILLTSFKTFVCYSINIVGYFSHSFGMRINSLQPPILLGIFIHLWCHIDLGHYLVNLSFISWFDPYFLYFYTVRYILFYTLFMYNYVLMTAFSLIGFLQRIFFVYLLFIKVKTEKIHARDHGIGISPR